MRVLIFGYGNISRGDDGLGVVFAERMERENFPGVTVETDYQLNAEAALEASLSDIVIFADASKTTKGPFSFSLLAPSSQITFTTHAMSPGSVLALCKELYCREPVAFLMAIRGVEWDLGAPMSAEAAGNLDNAIVHLRGLLRNPALGPLRAAVC